MHFKIVKCCQAKAVLVGTMQLKLKNSKHTGV